MKIIEVEDGVPIEGCPHSNVELQEGWWTYCPDCKKDILRAKLETKGVKGITGSIGSA